MIITRERFYEKFRLRTISKELADTRVTTFRTSNLPKYQIQPLWKLLKAGVKERIMNVDEEVYFVFTMPKKKEGVCK